MSHLAAHRTGLTGSRVRRTAASAALLAVTSTLVPLAGGALVSGADARPAPATSHTTQAHATARPVAARTGAKYRSFIAYRLTNAGLHRGQAARFEVRISGPAGVPTGTFQLLQEGVKVGETRVRADGRAVLKSSGLGRGLYHVRIRYSGDSTYFASRSPRLVFGVS